ncbi:retrotransposon protein, putative, ty1-copia subclass [Tanacetum coccineum]
MHLLYLEGLFQFTVCNGIYEIDMHNLVPNVNSIYNVSTTRAKHNLDSTYLWHCRLAHICKKRIEKLQHEGLLKSTDDESFDQCVSCLSGKMTRKSFPHRPERVTDWNGYSKKKAKNGQTKHGMEKTKSIRSQSQSKSEVSHMKKIRLEGLVRLNLKLCYKKQGLKSEITGEV